MKTGIVVSIVCPYPIAMEGFSSLLKGYAAKINNYYTAADLINSYGSENNKADIIIIDSTIGTSLVETTTKELTQKWERIKIVLIASGADTFSPDSFLNSGVRGIVSRGAAREELSHAISQVLANDYYFSEGLQYKLLQGILSEPGYMEMLKSDFDISEKELTIMRLVCTQKTFREMKVQLALNQRTIEALKERILKKPGIENAMGIVLFGLKHHLFATCDEKKAKRNDRSENS